MGCADSKPDPSITIEAHSVMPEVEAEWRTIRTPAASENRGHAAFVIVGGFLQKRVLPIVRAMRAEEKQAHAAGLKLILARAEAAVPAFAKCRCGAVEVRIGGGARHIFTCHCTMCAVQTKTDGGKAPTWTSCSREHCLIRGELNLYFSSTFGRRANCPSCGDAILMDYSLPNTIYIANAAPPPADLALSEQEIADGAQAMSASRASHHTEPSVSASSRATLWIASRRPQPRTLTSFGRTESPTPRPPRVSSSMTCH